MKNRLLCIVLASFMAVILTACVAEKPASAVEMFSESSEMSYASSSEEHSDSGDPESPDINESESSNIFEDILKEEHLDIEEAYGKLADLEPDGDEQTFADKLSRLIRCGGRFVQESETTGNRYTADVQFYLHYGEVYSSVVYTGYMGSIRDGLVDESADGAYQFESGTLGDFYGKEQNFSIFYSESKLRIVWSDTCDYILTRGDGSAEHAEEYRTPFEEKEVYQSIIKLIDDSYKDTAHHVFYDSDEKALHIVFETPELTKEALISGRNNVQLMGAWQGIVDNATTLGEKLYTVIQVGDDGEDVYVYWVDQLNDDNYYTSVNVLLLVDNDKVIYNIVDEYADDSSASSDSKSESVNSSPPATSAEENALEMAKRYIDYTAFSYSGLIDQLEFEGFSYTEAKYGADHCGSDWYEQAARKAAQYLDYTSFSRSGLKEQLIFEGFTESEAEYGVNRSY